MHQQREKKLCSWRKRHDFGPEVAKRNPLGGHGNPWAGLRPGRGEGEPRTDLPPRNGAQGTALTRMCLPPLSELSDGYRGCLSTPRLWWFSLFSAHSRFRTGMGVKPRMLSRVIIKSSKPHFLYGWGRPKYRFASCTADIWDHKALSNIKSVGGRAEAGGPACFDVNAS